MQETQIPPSPQTVGYPQEQEQDQAAPHPHHAGITKISGAVDPKHEPTWRRAIIVIDDSPDDSLFLSRMVQSCCNPDQAILVFNNSADFLEHMAYFSHSRFDIHKDREDLPMMVFLDLMMPEVDGPTVLRAMRADPLWDNVPVTVSTQSHNDRLLTDVLDVGANALLPKPFRRAEVFATLKKASHFSYNI